MPLTDEPRHAWPAQLTPGVEPSVLAFWQPSLAPAAGGARRFPPRDVASEPVFGNVRADRRRPSRDRRAPPAFRRPRDVREGPTRAEDPPDAARRPP